MDIKKFQNFYFVGIKGVAFTPLAVILSEMGKKVYGSDVADIFITDNVLANHSIHIDIDFPISVITKDIDCVIYSAAHNGINNHQVVRAKELSIPIFNQAELISELINLHKEKIVVTGSHGKTTTTAMLAFTLKKLGENPTYLVGSSNFNNLESGEYGNGNYIVVEGDEYGVMPPVDLTPKILLYHPNNVLLTNIDFDHPDVYSSIEHVELTFGALLQATAYMNNSEIVANGDDQRIVNILSHIDGSYITVGTEKHNDAQVDNILITHEGTQFTYNYLGKKFDVILRVFGEHNANNASLVITLLLKKGFSIDSIIQAISAFTGAKRRFEIIKKDISNNIYIDDYAHHPKEIDVTIKTAKKAFPDKKLIIIFQPHTISRTKSLEKDFMHSLAFADEVILTDIFTSAREHIDPNYTSKNLVEKYAIKNITYLPFNDVVTTIKDKHYNNCVIMTLGAGKVNDFQIQL